MNMNLDDQHDRAELSIYLEDYLMVEFVAVPPEFDIGNYLTLREHTGIFDNKVMTLDQVIKIAEAIRYSPIVSLMNNALLDVRVGCYLLSILDELGLILKSVHNPLRKDGFGYKEFLKRYIDNNKEKHVRPTYMRGQEAKRVNIVVVNIFQMMNQNVMDEAIQIAKNMQVHQKEVEKRLKSLGKLE